MRAIRLAFSGFLLAIGLLATGNGTAYAFEPIKTNTAPGDLPDFREAEDLFNKSQLTMTGQARLGYHYYIRAIAGYRLAQYWIRKGQPNSPDVKNGYAAARKEILLAEATFKEEIAKNNGGKAFCEKVLKFVQNLDAQITKETKQ